MPQTHRRRRELTVRGYLLLLTHYDPTWIKGKSRERPFNLNLALEIVEKLAQTGFNTLLIGVSDGVRYRSHPELRRRYSVPMSQLRELCAAARSHGLQVIPKLNFSRSLFNRHDDWLRAPGEERWAHFEDETYWARAWDCIDEIIAACRPERFFHVGMDEDHERSYSQYVAAILRLRAGLRERGLRTICWSDTALEYPSGQIYREKSEMAERQIPRDTVRLLWSYRRAPEREIRRIARAGHEIWGAPRGTPEAAVAFREALLAAGGTGLVMTHWIACQRRNRRVLLERIRNVGPAYIAPETAS